MNKRIIQSCRTCEGDCRVVHPHWKQYHAQAGNFTVAEFFLQLGYLPSEALPPITVACPTCQGVGEVPAPRAAAQPLSLWEEFALLLYKILGGAPL
ncbi:hypothetical protein Q5H92_22765 [Hymenobacter sp. M29]|uniref:Uncharacterized protein n=1 Tax=Hymenobacter mellowenesis TaxID=3063995 RepID=A0ABT9AH93_9BACT|nr:hypothetical protein [Hymenobacter sp. M29]MDO7849204.1 hypothetical protein [Hymenobacter sp. M29]